MKKFMTFLISVLIIGIAAANAQSPAPEPDTLKEVKQTDPEAKNLPQDNQYTKDHVKITSGEIPAEVKRTLESGTQFQGWERGTFYKSKSGNLYTLEITKGDTTRTYRFDSSGKPVNE
jgi:hypothetical protein